MYHKLSIQKIFKTFLLKIVVLWTSKNCSQDKILDFFKTLKDNLEDFLVVNGKKDISCLSNKVQAVFSFLELELDVVQWLTSWYSLKIVRNATSLYHPAQQENSKVSLESLQSVQLKNCIRMWWAASQSSLSSCLCFCELKSIPNDR